MRVKIHDSGVQLWLSSIDTSEWAATWPCSTLAGHRLFAEFDSNGLVDLTIDGRDGSSDVDSHEFNAIVSDMLASKLPQDHPCWFITVGQFV